jgi:protein-tyrosine-phosphatase
MIKIMFVCHGNICRSPMAEFIFRGMVKKGEIADRFVIKSSATSTEEILFIRRLSVSLQNTESVVTARGLFSSKNLTMTSTIISSAWTLIISETLCEFSAMTKTERFAG